MASTPSAESEPVRQDRRSHIGPVGWLIVVLVWVYRATLGHFMGGQCRFYPTCSQYMVDSVNKHGAWRGGWRGAKRICRCHPWSDGGIDPA